MKSFTKLVASGVFFLLAGCALVESESENETKVTPAEIPAAVKTAAEQAVPGLIIAEAEVETTDGVTVYELEGTADGRKCELKIRADGTVLRMKKDDGED